MLGESVWLRCPQKNELLLGWISNAAVMIKKKELLNKGFAPNVFVGSCKIWQSLNFPLYNITEADGRQASASTSCETRRQKVP
jgi:hypothetical protein